MASPSRSNPDYYYHWVRDSGIAIKAILLLYQSARTPAARQRYLGTLMDFVDFSRLIQWTAVHRGGGLGDPQFTVRGEPYTEPWGRPQHDGPAIRVIVLVHLAFVLLAEGKLELVREKLYDAKLPTDSVIKTDLEYISHHWRETCFDLWEEWSGHHFFTRLLERTALLKGAMLATRLGDVRAASWYLDQSNDLGEELRLHWDPQRRYLVATRYQEGGLRGQRSGLDSSVALAALGAYSLDDNPQVEDVYSVDHDQVLATLVALEETFGALYPINDPSRNIPGVAIGRYPEDRYDGYRTDSIGNPWPGITIAFAIYHYLLAKRYRASGKIVLTPTNLVFFQRLAVEDARFGPGEELPLGDPRFEEIVNALRIKGDTFLERVRYHANPDGSMSEQINRDTGFQQGAPDLSMNYAALLFGVEMRRRLLAPDHPATGCREPRAP